MSIWSRLFIPMKNGRSGRYLFRYYSSSFRISDAFDLLILVRLFSLPEGMKSPAIFAPSSIIRCLSSE